MKFYFNGGGYHELVDTLRKAGHEVVAGDAFWVNYIKTEYWHDYNTQILKDSIKRHRPDVYICSKGFRGDRGIHPEVNQWIKKRVGIMVYWSQDDPFVVNQFLRRFRPGYDIALSCTTQSFNKYKSAGIDPYLFWPAWDSLVRKLPPSNDKFDLLLVGTPYACTDIPRKNVALWAMRSKLRLGIFGPDSWISANRIGKGAKPFIQGDPRLKPFFKGRFNRWLDLHKLFASSKLNFSNHVRRAKMYLNDRVFLVMGAGGTLIMDHNPGIEKVFRHNVEILFYENWPTFEHRAKYLLDHDDFRREIGVNARKKILKEHTYANRARQLLEILKKYGFK